MMSRGNARKFRRSADKFKCITIGSKSITLCSLNLNIYYFDLTINYIIVWGWINNHVFYYHIVEWRSTKNISSTAQNRADVHLNFELHYSTKNWISDMSHEGMILKLLTSKINSSRFSSANGFIEFETIETIHFARYTIQAFSKLKLEG